MAKTRAKQRRIVTLARPKVELDTVADPYGDAKPIEVNRIVDPLLTLFRHKHITQRQYKAGDRYREAHETVNASPGGSMDFNRTRGATGRAPISPPIPFLEAAEALRKAKEKLWPRHHAIVHRVCALGKTFEAVAVELTALDLGRAYVRRDISTILSESLDMLAEMWEPEGTAREQKILAFATERSSVTDITSIEAQGGVHVTRDKVYWSDREISRSRGNRNQP